MPEMDFVFFCLTVGTYGWGQVEEKGFIRLPEPSYDGKVPVERAIEERRTIRDFQPKPFTWTNCHNCFGLPTGSR